MHDVDRFNALLQAQILKVPEQYLWMHRRFKGLSADYPDYYGRSSRDRRTAVVNREALP
jgi:KDO2-lipid IV(A) lauroyltransferase